MFDENSNFQNGLTSSPGRHISSCSISKHVRYGGNCIPSVDPNLLKRSFNMAEPPQTRVFAFVNYLSVCYFVDAIIELNICLMKVQTF